MPRTRKTNKHLPQHVYIRRGKYQLRYRDGHSKLFDSLEDVLIEWGAEYGRTTGEKVNDIITDYKIKVLPTKAPRTQKDYKDALDRLQLVFGNMRLRDLRPVHVYKYQDARAAQGAKVHVNREVAVLSVICAHGVRLGHTDYNICKQVRRRPEKPRERYVNNAELFIVYNLATEWMQKAISLTVITGIRLGDIFRIGPDNCTADGFQYQQGKTGRKLLIEWDDAGILKGCAARPPVSYHGFTTAWQRLMGKALQMGLEDRFTFHDLRAKAGSDADDWRLLGHTDRTTYERIYNRAPVRIMNKKAG